MPCAFALEKNPPFPTGLGILLAARENVGASLRNILFPTLAPMHYTQCSEQPWLVGLYHEMLSIYILTFFLDSHDYILGHS